MHAWHLGLGSQTRPNFGKPSQEKKCWGFFQGPSGRNTEWDGGSRFHQITLFPLSTHNKFSLSISENAWTREKNVGTLKLSICQCTPAATLPCDCGCPNIAAIPSMSLNESPRTCLSQQPSPSASDDSRLPSFTISCTSLPQPRRGNHYLAYHPAWYLDAWQ